MGGAVDCRTVCSLGKASSRLVLYMLEDDAVFGADGEVLSTSDFRRMGRNDLTFGLKHRQASTLS